jgi:sigma-54-interacting transcriptional regulator
MNTATDACPLDLYPTELATLRAHRHNLLIEGPVAATHAVLLLMQPHLGSPIVWRQPHTRVELAGNGAGALILEDVGSLTAEDQVRLIRFLDGRGSRRQIVCTAERPLFPRVAAGLFDPTLYYRLNVALLRV